MAEDLELIADYLDECPDEVWLSEHLHGLHMDGRGRVFLFGNGGGHATATHWATDLHKASAGQLDVRAPAESATLLSMAMNDYGAQRAYQNMMPPVSPLDTVIVFSASATSIDIVQLVEAVHRHCNVIGFFGAVTPLAQRCDQAVAKELEPEDVENAWTIYGHRLSRELRLRWIPSSSTSTES